MALRADDVDLGRDRDLVARFQNGDPEAFDDLYRRYFDRLHRFCLKRVGDPHDAEEVAQEAFVRALRAMPNLDGERRFYPWLTVIAARLCVDTHRRRSKVEASDVIDLGTVEGGQEDRLLAEDDRRLMGLALARLGPRHREVLALREEQGWSYQRIADHLEVSLGTVEALLFRARKALRREFDVVSGHQGRWVGLPVLGWAARRLHELRLRVEEMAGAALPALSSNALAAAVVVSSAAVAVGFAGGDGAGADRTVRTIASIPAAAAADTVPSRPVAAARLDRSAVTSSTAAAATTDAGRSGRRVLGGTAIADGDTGARKIDDAPVAHDAGPVSAGVDPNEAVRAAHAQGDAAREDVQAWSSEAEAAAGQTTGGVR